MQYIWLHFAVVDYKKIIKPNISYDVFQRKAETFILINNNGKYRFLFF